MSTGALTQQEIDALLMGIDSDRYKEKYEIKELRFCKSFFTVQDFVNWVVPKFGQVWIDEFGIKNKDNFIIERYTRQEFTNFISKLFPYSKFKVIHDVNSYLVEFYKDERVTYLY